MNSPTSVRKSKLAERTRNDYGFEWAAPTWANSSRENRHQVSGSFRIVLLDSSEFSFAVYYEWSNAPPNIQWNFSAPPDNLVSCLRTRLISMFELGITFYSFATKSWAVFILQTDGFHKMSQNFDRSKNYLILFLRIRTGLTKNKKKNEENFGFSRKIFVKMKNYLLIFIWMMNDKEEIDKMWIIKKRKMKKWGKFSFSKAWQLLRWFNRHLKGLIRRGVLARYEGKYEAWCKVN